MQRVKTVSAPVIVGTSTVDSRGRITLPRAIRQHLGVGPGDRVDFELLPDGRVLLRAKPSKVINGLAGKTREIFMLKKVNKATPRG